MEFCQIFIIFLYLYIEFFGAMLYNVYNTILQKREKELQKSTLFCNSFSLFYFPTFSYALALYRNVETGISQASAATTPVIFPSFHF